MNTKRHGKMIASLLLAGTLAAQIFPIPQFNAEETVVKQSRREAEIEEFPVTYQAGLSQVKDAYPNAKFIYFNTGLDWEEDLLTEDSELMIGRNLVSTGMDPIWKDMGEGTYDTKNEKFIEIEPGWNQASKEAIEYYMDPRNFLTAEEVFQFKSLAYDESETLEGVKELTKNSFMNGTTVSGEEETVYYPDLIYEVGQKTNLSPYLLTCRIKQEQGYGNNPMINGKYNKHYNYLNINAFGSTRSEIIKNAMTCAKEKGWDTPRKSIEGGAEILKKQYIENGQDCLYLHHFNVVAVNGKVSYAPYMTALQSAQSEGKQLKTAYKDPNTEFTFVIPVYENMPATYSKVPSEHVNRATEYLLTSLVLDNGEIAFGGFNPTTFEYNTSVNSDKESITVSAGVKHMGVHVYINGTHENNNSNIGEKTIELKNGENKIIIETRAPNGYRGRYNINIIKNNGEPFFNSVGMDMSKKETIIDEGLTIGEMKDKIVTANCTVQITDSYENEKKDNENCVSSDIILIHDDHGKEILRTYLKIIGDVNLDGIVDDSDIEFLINDILEIRQIPWQSRLYADMNNDGNISMIDLAQIRTLIDTPIVNADTISIALKAPEETLSGKTDIISIEATPGPYFAEGYLTYEEGKVDVESGNSGKIHFVINEGKVLMDNGSDHIEIKTLIETGTIQFNVHFTDVYNYVQQDSATLNDVTGVVKVVKPLDMNVTVKQEDEHTIYLHMKNNTMKSLTKINVDFGNYLTNRDKEPSQSIVGISKGKEYGIDLLIPKTLTTGDYSTNISISYHNAELTKWLITIPVSFHVEGHSHDDLHWDATRNEHKAYCKQCEETTVLPHDWYYETPTHLKCTTCGYEEDIRIEVPVSEIVIGKETAMIPRIYSNDSNIAGEDIKAKWYLNGEEVSQNYEFYYTFQAAGTYNIDVLLEWGGRHIVYSFDVTVLPEKDFQIESTTCNSLIIIPEEGFTYSVDDKEMQDGKANDLTPGIHTLTKKDESGKEIAKIEIMLSHKYQESIQWNCEENMHLIGECEFCKEKMDHEFENTPKQHAMSNYEFESEANTEHGTISKAKCLYGCGKTGNKELGDRMQHSFTNYVSNNDGTCCIIGTKTAQCDCGCGATHTIPDDTIVVGHEYEYKPYKPATAKTSALEIGTCKKCGKQNIRKVTGTRLTYLGQIDIEIAPAKSNRIELPEIKTRINGIAIESKLWIDQDGNEFDKSMVMSDGKYTLKRLIIKNTSKYSFDKNTKLFINGVLFNGPTKAIDNAVVFEDVGKFDFSSK